MRQNTTIKISPGSPEDELFQRALRLLYERFLEREGLTAEIAVALPEPEELPEPRATARRRYRCGSCEGRLSKMPVYRRVDMHLFDANLACEIGIVKAIVNQMLIQEMGTMDMWGDVEHGVIKETGRTWYRFDDNDLKKIFPYLSLPQIHTELKHLEELGKICCRRGVVTDYIWIS